MRTYGLFLEERLECFRVLKYDIEAERIPRPAQGQDNKVRTLGWTCLVRNSVVTLVQYIEIKTNGEPIILS